MENTTIPKPEEVKKKVQARLDLDKGKSLDELYMEATEGERLYNYYLKMEEGETWNR